MVTRNIIRKIQRWAQIDDILVLGLFLLILWVYLSIEWLHSHGVSHLLWFCDISLLLTGIGFVIRSRVLITAQLVGCFVFHLLWNVDFVIYLVSGHFLLGATDYIFYSDVSTTQKCLSLILHTAIVPCTLYGVFVLGSSQRAWLLQWLQTLIVFSLTIICTHPEQNINWMFGTRFEAISPSKIAPYIYYGLMIFVPPFLLYLPLNRLLIRVQKHYKLKKQHATRRIVTKKNTLLSHSFHVRRLSPISTIFLISVLVITMVLATRIVDHNFSLNNVWLSSKNGAGFSLESLLASPKRTSIHNIRFKNSNSESDIALKLLPDSKLSICWSSIGSSYEIQTQRLLLSSVIKLEEIPSVPHLITLSGVRNHKGSIVWGIVLSDNVYFQRLRDLHSQRSIFHVLCNIGDSNPSEFVGLDTGMLYSPNATSQITGNRVSDVYILGVVEVLDGRIVSRSSFYIVKRTRINS